MQKKAANDLRTLEDYSGETCDYIFDMAATIMIKYKDNHYISLRYREYCWGFDILGRKEPSFKIKVLMLINKNNTLESRLSILFIAVLLASLVTFIINNGTISMFSGLIIMSAILIIFGGYFCILLKAEEA